MRYRRLGSSDLSVSEISLGSWLTYGVGEVLGGRARDSYVLATKLFFPMTDTDRGLSRAQVEKQLDASLARLRTDYIDLYQCHRYDDETPLEQTMEALTRAVDSGKVRYLGFSEWPADKIQAAIDMAGVARFVSSQPQYSLLWRAPERDVIPVCAANGISQIVWSPLAQGVLTGKYKPGAALPPGTRATSAEMGGFISRLLEPNLLSAVEQLRPLAAEAGLSLAQFALAWALREPNVASAIVGASRPEQLEDNAAASGAEVDPALFTQAEAIVAAARRVD
jgi:aryl-alcohol dehydrogenase-like predicted oxidoreductase